VHASGHLPYIGARGSECTLIITEGDSAKALAVAGLEVVGRERYGVFPLRGKPLNVREASAKKVGDNEELTGLISLHLPSSPFISLCACRCETTRSSLD
jgi:hypothetical protein